MNKHEKLFLNTLDDIREKLSRGDEYSIIKASALLRHLLLDGNVSLLHLANKNHGIKPQFVVNDYLSKPPIKLLLHWMSLDPSSMRTKVLHTINLDTFLKAECLTFKEHDFTVKDIIKGCANYEGGVHSGKPRQDKHKEKNEAFLDLTEIFKIGGVPSSTAHLVGISRIILTALAPLEEKIRETN